MELEQNTTGAVVDDTSWQAGRSISPDAQMNLILRFETASGPRTVIACSVPRRVAAEIADVMRQAGQYAEFIDRCSPLSVADRLMINNLH